MHRSLQILHHLPGHEERAETCQVLADALLSALRPRVRKDVMGNDFNALQEYLYIYNKLVR